MSSYDPNQSNVSETTLADFMRAPLTGNITEVPGIGASTAALLAKGGMEHDRITNTFQLIGVFLLLKTENAELNRPITRRQHCDAFWMYLKNKGISRSRDSIVMAIAEKTNTMIAGLYDFNDYS